MAGIKVDGFTVTAPLVLLDPADAGHGAERELYAGADVPPQASQAWIDRMLEIGAIAPRFVFDEAS
jgi:hypothetical protein